MIMGTVISQTLRDLLTSRGIGCLSAFWFQSSETTTRGLTWSLSAKDFDEIVIALHHHRSSELMAKSATAAHKEGERQEASGWRGGQQDGR